MSDNIRVNGNLLSWASLGLKLDGDRYYGLKSISFSEAIESVLVHGMGKHYAPRARTRGKYTIEPLKVMGEVATLKAFRRALALKSKSGRAYGTVEFEVFLEAVESSEQSYTADFLRCKWAKNTSSFEEAPDGLYQEVEFSCMQISQDGLVLFDDTNGSTP